MQIFGDVPTFNVTLVMRNLNIEEGAALAKYRGGQHACAAF